ncbi:DDE-type integrase/transposase/recombinase [Hymenobacter terrenus]|uniref:DDE-type integrase/transposase/recombinase n=1 Tax=Hymenobacter terrenus TaxID=1629124 RepID=UPI000B1CFA43
MPEDLVSEALCWLPAGLMVHSDQGSHYEIVQFKDLLAGHGALQSMSRRGNCYDNAHTKSFRSRFKAELLDGGHFPVLAEATLEVSHRLLQCRTTLFRPRLPLT